MTPRVIAERLNALGIKSEYGRAWTRDIVHNIATNPKYTGANVLNRRSYKLGLSPKGRANPREAWILRERVFEPIIDVDTFRQAQKVAAGRNLHYSNEYLLDSLRRLFNRLGRLSVSLIEQDPETPSSGMYLERFGSMYEVYRRVGYEPGRPISSIERDQRLRALRRALVSQIVNELVANGATVHRNQPLGTVTINEEFTLRFATARCIQRPVGDRWPIRLHRTVKTDATLVARLTPTNDSVQDYCLFPHTMPWPPQITVI